MRSLEDCEVMFNELEVGERMQIGFRFEAGIDKGREVMLPIDFTVKAIDYNLSLAVAGIRIPIEVSPECVLEITGKPKTIWLSACYLVDDDHPPKIVFFGGNIDLRLEVIYAP